MNTAFFVDHERQARPGHGAGPFDDEQVRRLDAAACPEGRGGDDRSDSGQAPHALTATPPRRGSPAPAIVAPRRCTAWTPPKNRFSASKETTRRSVPASSRVSMPGSA